MNPVQSVWKGLRLPPAPVLAPAFRPVSWQQPGLSSDRVEVSFAANVQRKNVAADRLVPLSPIPMPWEQSFEDYWKTITLYAGINRDTAGELASKGLLRIRPAPLRTQTQRDANGHQNIYYNFRVELNPNRLNELGFYLNWSTNPHTAWHDFSYSNCAEQVFPNRYWLDEKNLPLLAIRVPRRLLETLEAENILKPENSGAAMEVTQKVAWLSQPTLAGFDPNTFDPEFFKSYSNLQDDYSEYCRRALVRNIDAPVKMPILSARELESIPLGQEFRFPQQANDLPSARRRDFEALFKQMQQLSMRDYWQAGYALEADAGYLSLEKPLSKGQAAVQREREELLARARTTGGPLQERLPTLPRDKTPAHRILANSPLMPDLLNYHGFNLWSDDAKKRRANAEKAYVLNHLLVDQRLDTGGLSSPSKLKSRRRLFTTIPGRAQDDFRRLYGLYNLYSHIIDALPCAPHGFTPNPWAHP